MPLYKRRVKQSYFSQSSEAIEEEPEVKTMKITSNIHQKSRSQTAIGDILQINQNLRSPVYPEALPRTASEPNESAFEEFKEFDVNDGDNKYFENKTTIISETEPTTTESNENCDDLFSDESKYEQIDTSLSMNAEIETIAEKNVEEITNNENVPENNENVDKIPFEKVPSTKSLKLSKSYKEGRTKVDKILKQGSSNRENITDLSSHHTGTKDQNVLPNESLEILNSSHNSTINSQDPNMSKGQYVDSLNLSSNQSFNESDAKKSNKLVNQGKSRRSKNKNVLSQRSDISMSDPVVKNAYMQFMKKKEKFYRVSTPKGLKQDEKMRWLQQQRNVGVYVHCDKCDKIRYLDDITDPLLLPQKWYCKNNPDLTHNKCEDEEEKFPAHVQEDWIDNLYNAGSLVWARVEGYPWWPGIVDDDPNTECYYWLDDEFNNTPSFYHVTFFDVKEVTRAWLKPNAIKPFIREMENPLYLPGHFSLFKKRIDIAMKLANEANEMALLARLKKFSFVSRYKKPINKPKDVKLEVNSKKSKKDVSPEDMKKGKSKENSNKTEKKKLEKPKKYKKRNIKSGKLQKEMDPYDSRELLFGDFEIPSSPVFDDISLELFEDV